MKLLILDVKYTSVFALKRGHEVCRQVSLLIASVVFMLASQPLLAGVVLTFDHNPLGNFVRVSQNYGDHVTVSPDSFGHQYGIVNDGFGTTPNVELAYGGSLPSIWTTGYGDLVNILFNDQDGETSLNLTLTADPGFEVGLFGFDIASFSNTGQTVQGLQVQDAMGNFNLFSQGSTFISGVSHNDFDFVGGLFATAITIDIDLTGLGTASDNVGIDNVYFIQREVSPIPVPAAVWLFGSGLAGLIGIAGKVQRVKQSAEGQAKCRGSAISSSQSIGNSYFFTVLIRKIQSTVQ